MMKTSASFREAALANNLDAMSRMLAAEPFLAEKENPENLPLERLTITVQFHMAILDGSLDREAIAGDGT